MSGAQEAGFFQVSCLPSTGSTNDDIKQAIHEGAPEGTVIVTLEQTGAYGRQGRKWVSPQGGLYLSLLLRPQSHGVHLADLPTLSLVISLAVHAALIEDIPDNQKADLLVKWPNDVMYEDKKLCGISLEAKDDAVCVGIGINVFEAAEKQEVGGKNTPALYSQVGGKLFDEGPENCILDDGLTFEQLLILEHLRIQLLLSIEASYRQWLETDFVSFMPHYNELSYLNDRDIQIVSRSGDKMCEGRVNYIDDIGRLWLSDADGTLQAVSSGEAHILY